MFLTIIARCPGPERAKPPHTRLYSRYDALFCRIGTRCKRGTLSYTNYRQNILPKGLRVIYVCFGIIQISLLGFPILPFFAGIFRIVESWTVYGSISVVLGSCVTSWMSWRCALGGILEGRPLLGRFTSVQFFFFHFFLFGDNGSHHGSLESKNLF